MATTQTKPAVGRPQVCACSGAVDPVVEEGPSLAPLHSTFAASSLASIFCQFLNLHVGNYDLAPTPRVRGGLLRFTLCWAWRTV